MKLLKTADQKYFEVCLDMYTDEEVQSMINAGIFYKLPLSESVKIDAKHLKEIKIVYNRECGIYETVAITNDGLKVHIWL